MKRKTIKNKRVEDNNTKNRWQQIRGVESYRPERYALAEGYYTTPSQQQLFANNGKCRELVIGNKHGRARWAGSIDISQLAAPLAETLSIRNAEIEVYIADKGKPQLGKELNKPCHVTFFTSSPHYRTELQEICTKNNTTLVATAQNGYQFTVLIPHFTFYSFTKVSKPKKETIQEANLANILVGPVKRNRILEQHRSLSTNGSVQQDETAPLMSARFQAEADELPQIVREPIKLNEIFDGLRDYITNAEQKLYETEVKLPTVNIQERQDALTVQNSNRALYGYPPYKPSAINLPALQNFMFSAEGHLIELKNYPNHKNIAFISREEATKLKDNRLNPLFLLEYSSTPEEIARLVCNVDNQLRTRRLLSLYAVLFSQEICFQFEKRKEYFPVLSSPIVIDSNLRLQFIKNWLTWISRLNYGDKVIDFLPYKTKLMASLALRKPILAQDNLIVNNCWSSAMILSSLEDKFLRQHLSQDNAEGFQPEIRMILQQSIQHLKCNQWQLCLAISAWYFKSSPFLDSLSQILDSSLFANKISQESGIQYRLFQLYLWNNGYKLKQCLHDNPRSSQKTLCYQWIVTNWLNLDQIQRKVWRDIEENGVDLFDHYKYEVAKAIITLLVSGNNQLARRVIECTNNLSQKEVQALESLVKTAQEREKQINWQKALKGDSIEAIKIGLNSQENESYYQDVYDLVSHPQILGTYDTSTSNKLREILASHQEQFADLILILRFQEDENIGLQQLQRLVEIYEGFTRFRKAISPATRGAIVAKLKMKLRYWIDHRKDSFKVLLHQVELLQKLKNLMKGTQLSEYLSLQSNK